MTSVDLGRYDTDKPAGYLASYEREIGHLFDQPIAMLELGVQRGGSMLLWRDLFPHATIAGLDLNEVNVPDDSGRLHVYQGYQQDGEILDRIASEVAPSGFDLIIDDASHLGLYTAQSFWHLFPRHLKPGGVYVLDDWGSGYWDHWADGKAFAGDRSTLGDFAAMSAESASSGPSRMESVRRRVRGAARPVAGRLSPDLRRRLERAYMAVEGATVQRRFSSHDYGMVGFVKQLVDAAAIGDIDRGRDAAFDNGIESVHVTSSQVFVHKRA